MIKAAHSIIYTADAEADRAFFRDVLGFPHVDAGDGWLVFALPPSEISFHPAETGGTQETYLVCEDLKTFIACMTDQGVACTEPVDQGWGVITNVTLPGGGELGVYEARHALAHG